MVFLNCIEPIQKDGNDEKLPIWLNAYFIAVCFLKLLGILFIWKNFFRLVLYFSPGVFDLGLHLACYVISISKQWHIEPESQKCPNKSWGKYFLNKTRMSGTSIAVLLLHHKLWLIVVCSYLVKTKHIVGSQEWLI